MRYRKRDPLEVEAVQVRRDKWDEVLGFVRKHGFYAPEVSVHDYLEIVLPAANGRSVHVREGEWILPGAGPGTFYKMHNPDFDNTYEPSPTNEKHQRPHIDENGKFQSDKYPEVPPDLVPLKVTDPMARDLLATYAVRRYTVDAEFSSDLLYRLSQTTS